MLSLVALVLSFVLSFGSALLCALTVYWLDRYEKEPKILLGGVFLWGAVVAFIGGVVFEEILDWGTRAVTGSPALDNALTGAVYAPIVEESLKGFAILIVFAIFRNEFDSILDGIVYAGIVALGFAATENSFYLFSLGYLKNGFPGLFSLFFLRDVLSIWNHPFYTAFAGIGLAIARLSPNLLLKLAAPILGWTMGVVGHGLHNAYIGSACFLVFPLEWLGWFLMFILIIWAIRREGKWIAAHLSELMHAGVISVEQYHTACSTWSQTMARYRALNAGHYRATSRFYQVCGELALKRQQRATLGEERGNTPIIERLEKELAELAPRAQV
jgi:RsiW-degrading membrane proteinase PrsW (M82 family)